MKRIPPSCRLSVGRIWGREPEDGVYSLGMQRIWQRQRWVMVLAMAGFAALFQGVRGEISVEAVEPLLARYCYACHGEEDATREADLNLAFYLQDRLLENSGDLLEELAWVVEEGDMPPVRSPQPTDRERETLLAWFEQALEKLRNARPNDPGTVVMPRLNHREYDNVIRDLTGLDLNAAATFPMDSGGGEGFTNVGENLVVTPTHTEGILRRRRRF